MTLSGRHWSKGRQFRSFSIAVTLDSALDKLLGQMGIYAAATWSSSIAYLQKQLRILYFFMPCFFSVITRFLIA